MSTTSGLLLLCVQEIYDEKTVTIPSIQLFPLLSEVINFLFQ